MLDSRINKWWCNVLDSGSNQTSSLSKQITLMLKYSSNHINVLWFSDMCCKSCNSPWSLSGLEWRSWVRLSFQELCCIMQWSWLFYFSCNTDRTWFLPKSYTCANKCGYMLSNAEPLFYKSDLVLFSTFFWKLRWYICAITSAVSSNTLY